MPVEIPAPPSLLLVSAFAVLGAAAVLFWLYVVRRVWPAPSGRRNLAAAGLVVWAGMGLALAFQPWFHVLDRFPPPALRLFLAGFVATLALGLSPIGRRIATTLPVSLLVGFQCFRMPVEWALAMGAAEGVVPPQLTWHGHNWDVVTGVLALPIAVAVARNPSLRPALWLWNVAGVGLLFNVVGTAIASLPGPLQAFTNPPVNVWISYAPFVWLPTLLVTSALMGHLLVFRWLLARSEPVADKAP